MSDSFHSQNVSAVDTTAKTTLLGHTVTQYVNALSKSRVYIYVKNTESTTWAVGDVIIQADDGTNELTYGHGIRRTATTSVPTSRVLGVVVVAIAQNQGGWIVHDGEVEVKLFDSTTTVAGDAIGTSGTGAAVGGCEIVADSAESFGRMVDEHSGTSGTETLTARIYCSKFRGTGQLT